ncbi:pfs domain-containing protein [Colletotrichum graminicola M1.001]|uniref:Pfs domain-containing protein n=1 Tax=Colletotrichum graminicola (strain M1.001 / M2 / FGSC 10212) TaxID=645133 RepID=E3QLI7_COLGM|nr:pfs domain-containing protein [Colletotrichum graminicola M1.001]EFQ31725.1 pfs domain-containing protein [Colletotrichum graminicola M1.001]
MCDEARTPETHEEYTLVVVCAMSFEMSAVRFMLDRQHPRLRAKDGDSNMYVVGELSGHNVVLACLPGNDRHDIRLGDVVVSMPEGQSGGVVQCDLGKDTDAGFVLKGSLWPPPSLLRSAVEMMRSDHLVSDNKIQDFVTAMLQKGPRLAAYQRPSHESDILFSEDYIHDTSSASCASCDRSNVVERAPRQPEGSVIHYGLIASGDSVLKSSAKRSVAVRSLGDVLCFEMEAAGIMSEFSCIVIRGISDYADSHKNDAWHYFAAAAAAACTKELLTYVDSSKAPSMSAVPTPSVNEASNLSRGTGGGHRFYGTGIQHSGSGNFSVGNDLHIR